MYVSPISRPSYNGDFGTRAGGEALAPLDPPKAPRSGEVIPPNGNPGIVPPWLLKHDRTDIAPQVIGIAPVDPNTPVIM